MSERDEWAAGALTHRDDEAEWEATRNLDLGLERGCVSRADMIAHFARDRAAVEAKSHREWVAERARMRWVAQLAIDRETTKQEGNP